MLLLEQVEQILAFGICSEGRCAAYEQKQGKRDSGYH
jgi:hypothetical protein